MSGYDNRKEEWTRRKSYLLRSLFEDEPMLSTISEEDESISQYSPSCTPNEYWKSRLLQPRDRSPSPLPELIIEVVPRRPKIYDDEPEAYYKRLEKHMKKLYRHDYLNCSSVSSDNNATESDQDLYFEESYTPDLGGTDGLDLEKSINNEDYRSVQNELSPNHESNVDKTTVSSSFGSTKKIETIAVIEKEMVSSDKSIYESTQSNKLSSIDSSSSDESSNDDQAEDERRDDFMELPENKGASSINETVSTIPEPDAMRREHARLSLFSIANDEFEKSHETLVLYQGKQLVFMEQSLGQDSNILVRRSTDVKGKATSTPNSRKSNSSRSSKRNSLSSRFEPYFSSSSSKSFIPKYDQAIQTSFSSEGSENQSLWQNFFLGTPMFFRLQS